MTHFWGLNHKLRNAGLRNIIVFYTTATLSLNHLWIGSIRKEQRVNSWHIKEFIFHVHKKENIGTELKQNNDWGHKAFFFLFLLCRIDFFLYPQKSFSCPWHISCIIFKTAEEHNPTRGALLPSAQRLSPPHPCSPITTRLVLFFIYFYYSSEEAKSQVQFVGGGKYLQESRAAVCFTVCPVPSRAQLQPLPWLAGDVSQSTLA